MPVALWADVGLLEVCDYCVQVGNYCVEAKSIAIAGCRLYAAHGVTSPAHWGRHAIGFRRCLPVNGGRRGEVNSTWVRRCCGAIIPCTTVAEFHFERARRGLKLSSEAQSCVGCDHNAILVQVSDLCDVLCSFRSCFPFYWQKIAERLSHCDTFAVSPIWAYEVQLLAEVPRISCLSGEDVLPSCKWEPWMIALQFVFLLVRACRLNRCKQSSV